MKILYLKLHLYNIPKNKYSHFYLSPNLNNLCYRLNNKEKVVNKLNLSFIYEQFPFIKVIVSTKKKEQMTIVYIYFNVNIRQLKDELNDPIKFNTKRKLFIDIIKKCYQENMHNYLTQLIFNIFRKAMLDNESTNRYLSSTMRWIQKLENKENVYYVYPSNIYKLSNSLYINILNGNIQNTCTKQKITLKGGILINNNNVQWICDFANIMDDINTKTHMYTKATLIICDKSMCTYYKHKI